MESKHEIPERECFRAKKLMYAAIRRAFGLFSRGSERDFFDEKVVSGSGGIHSEIPGVFPGESGVFYGPSMGLPVFAAGDRPPDFVVSDAVDGFVSDAKAGGVLGVGLGGEALGLDGDFEVSCVFGEFWS